MSHIKEGLCRLLQSIEQNVTLDKLLISLHRVLVSSTVKVDNNNNNIHVWYGYSICTACVNVCGVCLGCGVLVVWECGMYV